MTAPLAPHQTSRAGALTGPLVLGGIGLTAAAVLHLRDPHADGSYGFCPFLALTGLPCPGCGGLRAVNDVTRGDLVAAISSNAMAVALVVALTGLWAIWLSQRLRGRREAQMLSVTTPTVVVVVAVIVVFGVLRITPWGAWLAP